MYTQDFYRKQNKNLKQVKPIKQNKKMDKTI